MAVGDPPRACRALQAGVMIPRLVEASLGTAILQNPRIMHPRETLDYLQRA